MGSDNSKPSLLIRRRTVARCLECKKDANVVVPSRVTTIADCAFYGQKMETLTLPDSLTSIGSESFEHCSRLTSLALPNAVTYIGRDAFKNCSRLTSVSFPNSFTNIGPDAFMGCGAM